MQLDPPRRDLDVKAGMFSNSFPFLTDDSVALSGSRSNLGIKFRLPAVCSSSAEDGFEHLPLYIS